uniref:Coiled-coil domain containing 106b n=1 Tax=Tetraodon nigroviridis TaxID=99883 RepID=H3CJE2_TETNG
PHSQYSPFILVSNLRAHLYVALEKNAWLQKRIEELEEERNFLRCQLDRFIVSMRGPEGKRAPLLLWFSDQHNREKSSFIYQIKLHLTFNQQASLPRRSRLRPVLSADWSGDSQRAVKGQPASSPSPPSPMTTRSGMTLKRNQGSGSRSRRSAAVAGEAPSARLAAVKQEFHLEEENFFTEDEYVSSSEKGLNKKCRGRANGEPRMKMRRIFRITHGRERQRVKDPDGVLIRYKKILSTYQRVRSMSRAFQIHGVDRNTMASTSPIAELLLVAPEKMAEVGEFEASREKLLDYARRCYKTMDEQTHAKVQAMKKSHKLLPISYRFR